MSVAPGPTAGRGDITLQPSYFTSSLFVHPFREDVSNLVRLFSDAYATSPTTQPFALFKTIWNEEGWVWMHLKVFDARSRDTYLKVVMRLFLGALYSYTQSPALYLKRFYRAHGRD